MKLKFLRISILSVPVFLATALAAQKSPVEMGKKVISAFASEEHLELKANFASLSHLKRHDAELSPVYTPEEEAWLESEYPQMKAEFSKSLHAAEAQGTAAGVVWPTVKADSIRQSESDSYDVQVTIYFHSQKRHFALKCESIIEIQGVWYCRKRYYFPGDHRTIRNSNKHWISRRFRRILRT